MDELPPDLVDAVLDRLGVGGVVHARAVPAAGRAGPAAAADPPDRAALDAVYGAWCRSVPFDNLIKRVDLVAGTDPIRNDRAADFFSLWLAHGCGGTCWPSARALGSLLAAVGFDARLGSAAMGDEVTGPVPTHGTVLVAVEGELVWVDSSMLTDEPVPLVVGEATELAHPLRPVRVEPVGRRWRVHWETAARPGTIGCLLLDDDVDVEHFHLRYEASRTMGPFNHGIHATRNADDHLISFVGGCRIRLDAGGRTVDPPADDDERRRVLIDELGYGEELVDALPPDDPPPG